MDRIMELVVIEVSRNTRVPAESIKGQKREQRIAFARQLAMYAARELIGLSFPRIGAALKRDHTTVIHAYNRIAGQLRARPELGATIARLREGLGLAPKLHTPMEGPVYQDPRAVGPWQVDTGEAA